MTFDGVLGSVKVHKPGIRGAFGKVQSVSADTALVVPDGTTVAVKAQVFGGAVAANERRLMLYLPGNRTWVVLGTTVPTNPPSSMIQVASVISGDRADSWRLISDRTYSLTNITDNDIVLIADIWEANIAFVMPDQLWASDSSFQYNTLYLAHEGRIGFRLFWHKFTTGDSNGAMSVFTGGGEALWDDPASWPDPFNEFMFIRRAVWRIRGANTVDPFTAASHIYEADSNSTLAIPSYVSALNEIVIAMGCFTAPSASTLLGSVNAGPSPGFTNITNNTRGASAPGMGLSLNHTVGSPFAGTVSRSFTASAALDTVLSAIFGCKGA